MSLAPGTRLGPYEITGALGAGGMGEVYRARDSKLGRDVAIKVLPATLAQDAQRLARFEREARLLASLNHPNIAHVYGFESATLPDGTAAHFLAMELVEGEDLAERLKRGAIPIEEARAIARQIAEGLEAAHEKGIVHRDLKPANVQLTPDGKVKVLDFGLAKAFTGEGSTSGSDEMSHSPTMTHQGTEAGIILGTAAYMSPEQARGKTVDQRTDIWAFGVVLLEMLSGVRLFKGETVSDTLAAVLMRDVDWATLPAATPVPLSRLLQRCLDRDVRHRLQAIAEARIILEGPMIAESPAPPIAANQRHWTRTPAVWVAMTLAVLVGAIGVGVRTRGPTSSATKALTTFGIVAPDGQFLTRSQLPILSLSPDGRSLLFGAEDKQSASIYRRSFDRMAITRIEGTENAENPLLSPDGRSIAFFSGGMLRKVPAEGGAAVIVAKALAPRGLAWTPDGSLIFSPLYTGGLFRVSATGGEPVAVTMMDPARGERSHRWPQVLPDGRTVIFTVGNSESPGEYDSSNIEAQRLDGGERKIILKGARMARYSALGYLVYQKGETLLAVRFDPKSLEAEGEPFTIQEGVGGDPSSGSGYFAVSDTGVVAVVPEVSIAKTRVLVLVDPEGKETAIPTPAAAFTHPRFSPDGRRLTFAIGGGSAGDDDVYVLDLPSQRMQRLTFGQGHGMPMWSADGRGILYTNGRSGETGIRMKAANGSGEEVDILKSREFQLADSWHKDGRRLAITDAQKSIDVRILDTGPNGGVTPLFASPTAGESAAAFSPDGRYIAYQSTETGTDEVIVETFPPGGGKWQISVTGGITPVWARDGRTLFFVTGQSLMAVDTDLRGVLQAGTPRLLFTGPYDLRMVIQRNYDVGPDGRFVMVKRQPSASTLAELLVLDGWDALDPARGKR
ncbi:MAG: serine/threonine-protein kinase [Vicinamibacteria bacterium]|nr:serine/threonine-protein kinase [Vicinamibacteria bacterium]